MSDMVIERKSVTKERIKFKRPSKYSIFVLNNDVSSIDAVIVIIMGAFNKSPEEAIQIAQKAHTTGKALVVGNLSKEIADTLMSTASALSQEIDNGRLRFEVKETN